MQLSPHFSLEEFTFSEHAARLGVSNDPPIQVIDNLLIVAQKMERVREILGHPIFVTSAYRSPKVNHLVGGAPTSAHLTGWAVDFRSTFGNPYEVCCRIRDSGIQYDQLIHEYGRWTHISFAPALRQQNLSIFNSSSGYIRGIAPT